MSLVNKQEFVEIIKRLRDTNDTVDKVNDIFRNTVDSQISDFMNAASLMICNEDIVVKLLSKMFNNKDDIGWWLYECDYGRKFEIGMLKANGRDIDLSTAEKLYDYLVEQMYK